MTNIAILDSKLHRSLRVNTQAMARLGDNQRFVQVIVREFPHLAVHYPILFSKDSNTGVFYCGAMLGFDTGENLFLDEGNGQETYRPLNLQRAPFFIASNELAIDMDSPRIDETTGQYLFNQSGEPTPYLESIVTAFRDLRPGLEQTKLFIETLLKLNLIEPIQISAAFDDGEKRDVVGHYTINQDELRELPDAAILDLFRRGYLQLIYLMIASLKQIPVLAKRKNARLLQSGQTLSGNLL